MIRIFSSFFFLLLLTASVLADTSSLFLQEPNSAVPILLWSQNQFFTGNQQHLDTVNKIDIQFLFHATCSMNTETLSSSLNKYLDKNHQLPEVIVVFVEQKMSTDQLVQVSGGYQRNPSTDVPFHHLKTILEAAKSSLVIPYAYIQPSAPLTTSLTEFIDSFHTRFSSSAVIVSRSPNSALFAPLISKFTIKTHEELINFLKEEKTIYQNGAPDLIIVALDSNKFAEHDETIRTIDHIVSSKTNGNSISIFTADVPKHSHVQRSHTIEELDHFHVSVSKMASGILSGTGTGVDPYNVGMFDSYFPIQIFEIICVAAIILATVLIGSLCLFFSQTPKTYEVPKKQRVEMM